MDLTWLLLVLLVVVVVGGGLVGYKAWQVSRPLKPPEPGESVPAQGGPPQEERYVDMGKDVVYQDETDPTWLLMSLTMKGHFTHLTWVEESAEWVLHVDEQEWRGSTQIEVLRQAQADLDTPQ